MVGKLGFIIGWRDISPRGIFDQRRICLIRLRLGGNNRDNIEQFAPRSAGTHLAIRNFASDRDRCRLTAETAAATLVQIGKFSLFCRAPRN